VTTTTDYGINNIEKDRTIVTTSADGLSKTTQFDLDGNGSIDRTETDTTVVNLDGSKTESIRETDSSGNVVQSGTMTTSADGRSIILNENTAGGPYTEQTTIAPDGSSTTVAQGSNHNGQVVDTQFISVSADGRSKFVTGEDAHGNVVFTQSTQTNIDGSQSIATSSASLGNSSEFLNPNGLLAQILNGLGQITIFSTDLDGSTQTTTTD